MALCLFFNLFNFSFQPEKTGFTIFCDENSGVAKSKPAPSKGLGLKVQDKENIPVQAAAPVLGTVKVVDSFSDSDADGMETDVSSPMVVDTTVTSTAAAQQWRVPPLTQHNPDTAVDIFSAPEYAEVGVEVFSFFALCPLCFLGDDLLF